MTCDVAGDRVDLGRTFHRGDDSQPVPRARGTDHGDREPEILTSVSRGGSGVPDRAHRRRRRPSSRWYCTWGWASYQEAIALSLIYSSFTKIVGAAQQPGNGRRKLDAPVRAHRCSRRDRRLQAGLRGASGRPGGVPVRPRRGADTGLGASPWRRACRSLLLAPSPSRSAGHVAHRDRDDHPARCRHPDGPDAQAAASSSCRCCGCSTCRD